VKVNLLSWIAYSNKQPIGSYRVKVKLNRHLNMPASFMGKIVSLYHRGSKSSIQIALAPTPLKHVIPRRSHGSAILQLLFIPRREFPVTILVNWWYPENSKKPHQNKPGPGCAHARRFYHHTKRSKSSGSCKWYPAKLGELTRHTRLTDYCMGEQSSLDSSFRDSGEYCPSQKCCQTDLKSFNPSLDDAEHQTASYCQHTSSWECWCR
jgi:hypothetical protein